ncbi:Acb2/Tad1 domain-containing protein [Carnimonas bestiolae]|uniref:Acb2/Tad1 domain-containing protein n=1 Tax=Carnimonas bestiolae TaxID=3402172 RepID=UPI003F4A9BB9
MTPVIGYTELSDDQKEQANQIKEKINDIGNLLDQLSEKGGDQRAISIAKTNLQTASMWAVRSVFKPDSFAQHYVTRDVKTTDSAPTADNSRHISIPL